MCRIAWAWLSASLCFSVAGCAAGDSTMGDINGDPGLEVSLEASSEASAPPYTHDGGSVGDPDGPNGTADSSVPSVDSGHADDSGRVDAQLHDATEPVADASSTEASTSDSGVAEAGNTPDSAASESGPPSDVCPSGAKYSVEAAAAVISGGATFCPTGSCPAGQCCYEQVSPANVCVAK